jgi:hypothetical protein
MADFWAKKGYQTGDFGSIAVSSPFSGNGKGGEPSYDLLAKLGLFMRPPYDRLSSLSVKKTGCKACRTVRLKPSFHKPVTTPWAANSDPIVLYPSSIAAIMIYWAFSFLGT